MITEYSMYNASVPVLLRLLDNLEHILKLGEANAKERDIDPSVFLNARLTADMAHLIKQVQFATSLIKNCAHRISATEPPVFEETENSFDDLYTTIERARAEVNKCTVDNVNANEARNFTVKLGPMEREFNSLSYLSGFTLPNVYFHITTAYNILRQNGVPLGKMDFFGGKMS